MQEVDEFPPVIAERYNFEEIVGRGGMALVARVLDTTTGRRIALKRMRPGGDEGTRDRARKLFEREYRVLSQVSHPRVVEVLDYGVDEGVPYYTMELLDGGDLVALAPLSWRRVCEVGRDICSALSLVHARRMVYRDLSPRNVRCTGDGQAKLLDFGAMAPIGSAKFAVCTPAVAAPEVVNLQALDARTDLYALGATLYQSLTGRAPYPAANFRQLEQLWAHPVAPPSSLVDDIPPALDGLVMDLLQLEPNVRPESAAEVSERLAAIAGLSTGELPVVAQAYLTTPTLVGRDAELERVDRRLARLKGGGRGGAMALCGVAGSGLSRLLGACVLQAKIDGITTLRVSGDAGITGGHAAAHELVDQLLVACPSLALEAAGPHWDVLASVLPELAERAPERAVEPLDAETLQARALPALRGWLLDIANRLPLVLAVDDVERLDAESRNLVALLAEQCRRYPLLLVAARHVDSESSCAAIDLLDASCRAIELAPLNEDDVRALLASIFGEVPHLQRLVHHLHRLSGGNPRDLMQLAQHLVDEGIIHYRERGWALPESLEGVGAPASMADALRARARQLGEGALTLARVVVLSNGESFSYAECMTLGDDASLTELLRTGVLAPVGDAYRLAAPQWAEPLLADLDADARQPMHERLATVFEGRGDGVRAARHLLAAGRKIEAVDVLADHALRSYAVTNADLLAYMRFLEGLPHDWLQIYEETLAVAEKHPRRRPILYALQNRLIGIVSQTNVAAGGHGLALLQTLAAEAGLDLYEAMADEPDPAARLQAAIGKAMERHAARPEHEQICDPITALRSLARTIIAGIGNLSNSLDVESWERYPSLEPVKPLSPALAVVNDLMAGFDARRRGSYLRALSIYRGVLERISPPNDVGLEPTYVQGMLSGINTIIGIFEGAMGRPAWREAAEVVAAHPQHHANALLIASVAARWQGDNVEAERLEQEYERVLLEQRRPQAYAGMGLLWRFQACAVSEDLTGTGQLLPQFERIAARTPSWEPILSWARGEYEAIRGDHAAALVHLDEALEGFEPGRHQLWPQAAATRLIVLCALGRDADALADGAEQLEVAVEYELEPSGVGIRMAIALAAARLGDARTAWRRVDETLETLTAQGVTGLNLGVAFETAASVAVYLGDRAAFERHAPRCREVYLEHANRALSSKYARLLRAAHRAGLVDGPAAPEATSLPAVHPVVTQLTSILETCSDPRDCMRRSLDLIAEQGGARGAYLITLDAGRATVGAQSGTEQLPQSVIEDAECVLRAEDDDDGATQGAGSTVVDLERGDSDYKQLVLGHYRAGDYVVSGLLLLREPERELPSATQLVDQLSRFIEGTRAKWHAAAVGASQVPPPH